MTVEGTLVRMEHSSSGTEFSQGQVSACARLLVVRLEATIVAFPGESKRCEMRNGGVCSVGSPVRHSPDAGSIAISPE